MVSTATYQLACQLSRIAGRPVRNGFGGQSDLLDPSRGEALENRQITIDDQTVRRSAISATQANFQIPSNAALGTARVALHSGWVIQENWCRRQHARSRRSFAGLFTTNEGGSGQAAVVNQDGTINSASNPAPVGSTVTLCRQGAGTCEPGSARWRRGDTRLCPIP